ncbi:hypothetical protein KI387_031836, partial [Taxus chinensis]
VSTDGTFEEMIGVFREMANELTKHNMSLVYRMMYVAHPHETWLSVLMMVTVGCYAQPDSEDSHFPRGLMGVLQDMIEER